MKQLIWQNMFRLIMVQVMLILNGMKMQHLVQ